MFIAYDYARGENGQEASARRTASTPHDGYVYKTNGSIHVPSLSWQVTMTGSDEPDSYSDWRNANANFEEQGLNSQGDHLMCSLSQHSRMTRQIALDRKILEKFAFILSHKLRAPIANALGLAQLLESEIISEDERAHCQQFLCASVREIDNEIKAMNDVMTEYLSRVPES